MNSDQALALEVTNVHKSFGDHEVLKGIDLAAHRGDVISILGSSGSGKSTFLRCINFLELPNQGSFRVAGEQIELKSNQLGLLEPANKSQIERIRSRLSMVFQSFNLWSHMTILENIIEAPVHVHHEPKKEAIEYARHLLDKVGIVGKEDFYPISLSGGQQQRVAIARALAMRPEAMLFDEPTSALDPELVGDVLKVMRTLAEEGTTMLIVTHEMAFAREVSSKVIFLHNGMIEEQGTPDEVFNNATSERCQQFLQTQF